MYRQQPTGVLKLSESEGDSSDGAEAKKTVPAASSALGSLVPGNATVTSGGAIKLGDDDPTAPRIVLPGAVASSVEGISIRTDPLPGEFQADKADW
jgi:hypothetical protein